MKKWHAFILLVAALSSCKGKKQDYFEGIVESTIVFETFYKADLEGISKSYGKRSTTYINKRGNICREIFGENDALVRKDIIRIDSLKMYSFNSQSDTMSVTNISERGNSRLIGFETTAPKDIMGKQIKGIKASYKLALKYSKDSMPYTITYYNSPDYKINPSSVNSLKMDYYDSVMAKNTFVTLRYEQNYGDFTKMYVTANKIESKAVPDSIFKIPQNKIRVATQQ